MVRLAFSMNPRETIRINGLNMTCNSTSIVCSQIEPNSGTWNCRIMCTVDKQLPVKFDFRSTTRSHNCPLAIINNCRVVIEFDPPENASPTRFARFTDEAQAKKLNANCKLRFEDSDEAVFVNREFLSVYSTVFRVMFEGEFKEKNAPELKIHQNRDDFLHFLDCLYGHTNGLGYYNIQTVAKLADFYDCTVVINECKMFLENNEPVLVDEYKTLIEMTQNYEMYNVLTRTVEKATAAILGALQSDDEWMLSLEPDSRKIIAIAIQKKLLQ